tara:strand:- start:172 stop:315 length:144 start_codon:yes stop_codon:yes gene_type:complete
MKLNKEETKFLDDHWNDIYYSLDVENMTYEGKSIFLSIQKKLSKETN